MWENHIEKTLEQGGKHPQSWNNLNNNKIVEVLTYNSKNKIYDLIGIKQLFLTEEF